MTTAFSWGYKGWGNHTRELVRLVDVVEAERGFEPPLFVDVRLRRSVRAVGFRDRAFEQLLGERYVWLRGLGNRAIAEPSLPMQLADASEADRLAELARVSKRRVIFFCSCASPDERPTCHRRLVVDELVKRGVPTQEWPGGAPVLTRAPFTITGKAIRLPEPLGLGALPHYSIVRTPSAIAIASPAIRTARGWVLPVHGTAAEVSDELLARCDRTRSQLALELFGGTDRERRWREI